MAALTTSEKADLRNGVERSCVANAVPIAYTKAQIDAAFQAIEDVWESNALKNAISNAIEGAASGVFTVAQKKRLVAYWLRQKFGREGV